MLLNIIYIIFILSTFTLCSYGAHISDCNETQLILSISSQLSEFKDKLANAPVKDLDVQLLRMDLQLIRAEQDRQKNVILAVKSDIQFHRAETERQRESALDKEAVIQTLQAELEQQKKSLLVKEVENQSLRAQLEKQNKEVLYRESLIKSLRAEREEQVKLVERLLKEADKQFNCAEAKFSGIQDIHVPKFSSQPFQAACDADTRGGGWTIILRRMDGSVNFYRNWTEYKNGFGNLDGEYFLGLDKIHAITAERRQELLVLLEDFEGDERFETYAEFAIGNEDEQYKLKTLGKANGTAGNSLYWHRGMKFTTFDRDNDDWDDENCAILNTGAWWYDECQTCQLTGTYRDYREDKGVTWNDFRGSEYSLKRAIMMIRPIKQGS